jgi:hypothetical protein
VKHTEEHFERDIQDRRKYGVEDLLKGMFMT